MGSKWTKYKAGVGGRLRAARETLGLDQGEVGKILGVNGNMVSMIESGIRGLDPEKAVLLKKTKGVTLDFLYADDPSALSKALHDKLMKPKAVPAQREGKRSHVA